MSKPPFKYSPLHVTNTAGGHVDLWPHLVYRKLFHIKESIFSMTIIHVSDGFFVPLGSKKVN